MKLDDAIVTVTRQEFYFSRRPLSGELIFRERRALIVDVAPHMASVASFVIIKTGRIWYVINVESNCDCAHDENPFEACLKARLRLAQYDRVDMEDSMRKALEWRQCEGPVPKPA